MRKMWVVIGLLFLAARGANSETIKHKSGKEMNKAGIEWVSIPGGAFKMGSNNDWSEQPVHKVTIKGFEMSKTEVTVEQYKACVDSGTCTNPDKEFDCNWGKSGREKHPINCVSWDQAVTFATWAGGRLPSESEWEYAATSCGKNWKYPWGNEKAKCDRAVMSGNGSYGCGRNSTWPVCSKTEGNTRQGLCDMAGNVWEWVQDTWHRSYEGAPQDGSAWVDPKGPGRVIRGGSWGRGAGHLRSAQRSYTPPGSGDFVGFRLTRSSR
ncbi:MAG: formylglycine-generating enzyme family protein [Elusimicrobia bacterium]|nr:formylglycine-generating enzyme family protein [Elusimicrobiota bacterium]